MCGITAFIGYFSGYKYVLDGLKMLQNRGYDGSSISGLNDNNEFLEKKYIKSTDYSVMDKLSVFEDYFSTCQLIMSHNRWRTSSANTVQNLHPYYNFTKTFSLVHNGIIENYTELKNELITNHKIPFQTQTDTEIIVQLIGLYYKQTNDVTKAIDMTLDRLEGTYALVILCKDTPDKMYLVRHGSPLLIGFGEDFAMVASEQSGFSSYVENYVCLKNNDVVTLTKKDGKIEYNKMHNYMVWKVTTKDISLTPAPYTTWMLKEIHEQYDASLRAIGGRLLNDTEVKLGGLESHTEMLKKMDHLILLGCGTSYNAGLMCLNIFKKISGFNTVQIFDGAEFEPDDIPKRGSTALILLTQSGETKDLYQCLTISKENNLFTIGVVNVVDSLIAREVHCGVYLNAGREVAVASTKSFSSQIIVLHLIAVWFAQNRNINKIHRYNVIKSLRNLPYEIKSVIASTEKQVTKVARYLNKYESTFILGMGESYAACLETSLKIKEIGYINANGFGSTVMKHGVFPILRDNYPVVFIAPDNKYFKSNMNVVNEIKARGAYSICLSNKDLNKTNCDIKIKIPDNKIFVHLLSVIPMQLVAYHIGIMNNYTVDKPKFLAKIITV